MRTAIGQFLAIVALGLTTTIYAGLALGQNAWDGIPPAVEQRPLDPPALFQGVLDQPILLRAIPLLPAPPVSMARKRCSKSDLPSG